MTAIDNYLRHIEMTPMEIREFWWNHAPQAANTTRAERIMGVTYAQFTNALAARAEKPKGRRVP